MKTKIRALACDLDGTLINSKPSIIFGVQQLMADLGLPKPGEKRLRELIGLPMPDIFTAIDLDIAMYDELYEGYSAHMYDHMRNNLRAFPGVSAALQIARDRSLKIAIVTSRGHSSLLPCLELAGIDAKLFDVLIAREDTPVHKPSPIPLQLAAQKLGCNPQDMLYVGDSLVDVDAAIAAGCPVLFAEYDADIPLKLEHESKVLGRLSAFDELQQYF